MTRLSLFAALSGAFVAACSSNAEQPPSSEQNLTDGIVIEAPEATRQAIGVSSWGIAASAESTVVRGYNGDNDEILAFEYRTTHGNEGSTFEATLDSGKNHVAIRVLAPEGSEEVEVLDDSFRGVKRANEIVERITADLKVQPSVGGNALSVGKLSVSSLRPLDEQPPTLTDACTPNLVPGSSQAGQTVTDCSKNPSAAACKNGVTNSGTAKCCGSSVATASQYLGRNASELKGSGALPMNGAVPSNVCCANFVTAVLQQSGFINWHSDLVQTVESKLRGEGWTDTSNPKPGDVVIFNGNDGTTENDHIELVYSNEGGKLTFIGSNNINSDGSQQISLDTRTRNAVEYLTPPASQCK